MERWGVPRDLSATQGNKGGQVQIYIDACPFWRNQRERPIRSRFPRGNAPIGGGGESLGRVGAKFGRHARGPSSILCGPGDGSLRAIWGRI